MEMNDDKLRDAVYGNIEGNPYADRFAKVVYGVCDTAIQYKQDGVDDLDEAVSQAIDNDMIYYEDQWLMMAYYQYDEPENANLNSAFEELHGDVSEIVTMYLELDRPEYEKDEDMDESRHRHGRMLREGRRPFRKRMMKEDYRKVNQRQLKQMVRDGFAEDITNIGFDGARKLREEEGYLEIIGTGYGVYGVNCAWLKGRNTGTNYVITTRNSTLESLV